MCDTYQYLCFHLVIIICLSVCLSGNTVSPNTTIMDTSATTQSPDTSTTLADSTTLQDTTSKVTETSSISKLMEGAKQKSTKTLVITDITKQTSATAKSLSTTTSPETSTSTLKGNMTTLSSKSSSSLPTSPISSLTPNTTLSTKESSAVTSATATTASTRQSSSSKASFETITQALGISAVKVQGKKKRLALSDIASSSTTTTTTRTTTSKPSIKISRKKKKRRPSRQPKKQKALVDDAKSETMTPLGPGKLQASPETTAYPLSPDVTIHTVEPGVKPVLFAAAAADNKKNGGGKKAGKKGAKKGGKAQGRKGDTGPPGPPGPKGAKGEPGSAAQSSMPMQAASSAVLTEHFGPDKDVIVPFDLKLIDLADNYDNTTGVFICTIPGVYVVSLYLMSHPGAKVNARVFINSRPIAALWADDNKNSGFYPSSSIQAVSRLAFGDQVYVMLVDGGYGESWVHANYNAFSLFLLYEDVFFK